MSDSFKLLSRDDVESAIARGIGSLTQRLESKEQLAARLSEAKLILERYVKSEANAEMATVLIRLIETLIDGDAKTPMRSHHHE